MFKEEREESQFEWSMLRDLLIREFGVEKTDRIIFEAGKKAGEEYCKNILTEHKDLDGLFADLQRTMRELGIGIFRVESADYEKGSFVVTVAEDLDCSGRTYTLLLHESDLQTSRREIASWNLAIPIHPARNSRSHLHFTSVPPAVQGRLQRLTDGAKGP